MAIPQYNLDEWFAPPRHDNGQDEAIKAILADAKRFAETINAALSDGQEKQQAIEFIRQAVLAAELSIRWKWPAGKLSLM